jgi:sec-independent protein translocase protein TatC
MRKTKNKPATRHARNQPLKQSAPEKIPFIAHLYELRKRLFYIGLSVGVFGAAAIAIQEQLTDALLKPANGQQFIYTTPGGGFDFVFKLCLYTGIAGSIPVIVYQLIRYLQPLVNHQTARFVMISSVWSSALALLGIAFGYFVGLPAAMHFLLKGFSSEQIQALISIQSYMSFVLVYLLGSALLFQLPLVLLVINKLKPLKPSTLFKQQRWVILGAFIAGAVISPTPDIRNQAMLSGPIILMYELSIVLIWAINRKNRKPKKILKLLEKDAEAQAARQAQFKEAQAMWRQLAQDNSQAVAKSAIKNTALVPVAPEPDTVRTASQAVAAAQPVRSTVRPGRPQRYVQEFSQRRPVRISIAQTPQAE